MEIPLAVGAVGDIGKNQRGKMKYHGQAWWWGLGVVLSLLLQGCGTVPGSWDGYPTFEEQQVTRRIYLMPVDHITNVFQIDCMFNDSTLTHGTFYSFNRTNLFWYYDSIGTTRFFLYFEDVRGQQVYIPLEWLETWKVTEYNPSDMKLYDMKRREILQYYDNNIVGAKP
jgi:hypothetical protein